MTAWLENTVAENQKLDVAFAAVSLAERPTAYARLREQGKDYTLDNIPGARERDFAQVRKIGKDFKESEASILPVLICLAGD